jgi:two-component system KDP operon response regulator KdpE
LALPRFCSANKKRPTLSDETILVVDDEPQIRRLLRSTLSSGSYTTIEAKNGQEAIEKLMQERPDLILLDINMPEMNGLEACKKIRLSYDGPVIIMTVRSSERDKVLALDAGADGYVVKPFSMEELLARIRSALRRSHAQAALSRIQTSQLTVDLENKIVEVRGKRVHLSPKEFDLLRVLVIQRNKPLTHKRILQTVWGPDYAEETESLRFLINQLRKKIEKDPSNPQYIITEPWLGYRFQLTTSIPEKKSSPES